MDRLGHPTPHNGNPLYLVLKVSLSSPRQFTGNQLAKPIAADRSLLLVILSKQGITNKIDSDTCTPMQALCPIKSTSIVTSKV